MIATASTIATTDKIDLAAAFARFADTWSPKIVGEVNDAHVKLVKLQGEFVWHHHEREDELFLVIHGRMTIHLRDRDVTLGAGEFFIVPHGVEHKPEAAEECHVLLLEPKGTLNTGNVVNERTVADLQRL
jgi:mannose-6-phosphate isomerase-like protein (cupin superfamily)